MATDKLARVFIDALGLAPDVDCRTLAYRQAPEWDSVAHMQLVGEIEDVFGVMLDTEDVLAMSSFTEAERILTRHGVSLD